MLFFLTATRRAILFSAPAALIAPPSSASDDPYSHWAYGKVPPPIEKTIGYDEVMQEIRDGQIESLQVAVQHDCVIATTKEGHRHSVLIPDDELSALMLDAMNEDVHLPLLPVSDTLQSVHTLAQLSLATGVASTLYDLATGNFVQYGSLDQRERGEEIRFLNPFRNESSSAHDDTDEDV